MKIAIVGSGIAGIAAASELAEQGHDVVVYEKDSHVGGHAWTYDVKGIPVDIGFQVFNSVTYPNMINWWSKHGVQIEPSDMSFAVSINRGWLEWSSEASGLFAQRVNLLNPYFYSMIRDMVRFKGQAEAFLDQKQPDLKTTLGEFLKKNRYGKYFIDYYMMPMCAAVWSCPNSVCFEFPAWFVLSFMKNHHMFQLTGRPQWLTVHERTQKGYVRKVCKSFWKKIRLNTPVKKVANTEDGRVMVIDGKGKSEVYDRVVIAAHAPQALELLGDDATDEEKKILGAFEYQDNDVYLHQDASLMPIRRNTWAAWNFLGSNDKGVAVSYWINRLQNINTKEQIFVTLNPSQKPNVALTTAHFKMDHPKPTLQSALAQRVIGSIQGKRNIWFAGAYQGFGFHEDGFKSGLGAAMHILGNLKWAPIPNPRQFSGTLFQTVHRQLVLLALKRFIYGSCLEIQEAGGDIMVFGDRKSEVCATIRVHSPEFYSQVFFSSDLGLAHSYINALFTCSDMMSLFRVFILSQNHSRKVQGKSVVGLVPIQTLFATLFHRFFRANTVTQSRKNIHAHYDIGNEFFKIWLDESMLYSSAIFKTPTDTLYQAQMNKLDELIAKAQIRSTDRVLEIGFGWGALAIAVVKKTGATVHGITLSEEQLAYATKLVKQQGLEKYITFELVDYRVFARRNPGRFNKILSCEMLEAVGHEYLGAFFNACDTLLAPEGTATVQVITYPDDNYENYRKGCDFIQHYIFPGAVCPSVSALLEAMRKNSHLTVEKMDNIGPHYATTLGMWLDNFHANKDKILKLSPKFDEKFFRMWEYYLVYCQAGFATRMLGDHQIVFTRPHNLSLKVAIPQS